MKRSLVLVPILLLVLLNACGPTQGEVQEMVNQALTGIAATQTATNLPPPTGTPDPNERIIVDSLNGYNYQDGSNILAPDYGGDGISPDWAVKLGQLEDTIGADLVILDVRFPLIEEGPAVIFQVHARCECATNGPCCSPERMFVMTIRRLYIAVQQPNPQIGSVLGQVPMTAQEFQVVCYDHRNAMITMVVPWATVQSFFRGEINGYQFGMQVERQ